MKQRKKQAFALTELLVVVVVVGVLAAVVLPKFNKIMETRKTMEAEEVMAAVRMEQEKRCALDKPYIGNIAKLSEIIPQETTANFHYELESTGMLASSKGNYSYNLKMPSYADGRLCCDGDECDKLNKNYPSCEELTAKEDYQVATACAPEISEDPATKTPCAASCPSGQRRNVTVFYEEDGQCCIDKTLCPEECAAGMKRDPDVTYVEDGECCLSKEPCSCGEGMKLNPHVQYMEDATAENPCCFSKPQCPDKCEDGKVRNPSVTYEEDGECCWYQFKPKAMNLDPILFKVTGSDDNYKKTYRIRTIVVDGGDYAYFYNADVDSYIKLPCWKDMKTLPNGRKFMDIAEAKDKLCSEVSGGIDNLCSSCDSSVSICENYCVNDKFMNLTPSDITGHHECRYKDALLLDMLCSHDNYLKLYKVVDDDPNYYCRDSAIKYLGNWNGGNISTGDTNMVFCEKVTQ